MNNSALLSFLCLFALLHQSLAASPQFNVIQFGAKPDGRTDSTSAFLAAWKQACSSTRGVTLYVPKGRFLTRSMLFKGPCRNSAIFIRIDGTLVAPSDIWAIGNNPNWIEFQYVNGVTISGGVLDGKGAPLWSCKLAGRKCPTGATKTDSGVFVLQQRSGERGDVAQQPDVPRGHQLLPERETARRQDLRPRELAQHGRNPHPDVHRRDRRQHEGRHRRRLRLHRPRGFNYTELEANQPCDNVQHWEPRQECERARGAECDSEVNHIHRNDERAEDQIVGEAQQRVRQKHSLPTCYDEQCAESHLHRPALLPRQKLSGHGKKKLKKFFQSPLCFVLP
ncbi:unnamed protein product [Linum tenue]|uniref:Polygalacturonase n=1 Tax=Linum tenue TaxID=586396 RepID=A0AAV0PHE3_9ROSI|nr:unnamed protein product [Linum tenue]